MNGGTYFRWGPIFKESVKINTVGYLGSGKNEA